MADQDFAINIVATANTAAIKLTADQLTALQTAAQQGNKDAIDALKKIEQAQKAADAEQQKLNDEQARGIRIASGYGLIIGGIVANAIREIAVEQQKVTKELDQQGASLVRNVQEWQRLAQGANSLEELAAGGSKASAEIDQIKNKLRDANDEVLTVTQSAQDMIVKFATWTPFGTGPNQALLDEKLKGLQADLAQAEIAASHIFKQRFDEIKEVGEGIDPVIQKVEKELQRATLLASNLKSGGDIQSWVAQEQIVERLERRLQNLLGLRKQLESTGQPTTPAGVLQNQLQQLNQFSNLPLSTTDETALRNAQENTRRALRDQQIKDEAAQRSLDASAHGVAPSFFSGQVPGQDQAQVNQALLTVLNKLLAVFGP